MKSMQHVGCTVGREADRPIDYVKNGQGSGRSTCIHHNGKKPLYTTKLYRVEWVEMHFGRSEHLLE